MAKSNSKKTGLVQVTGLNETLRAMTKMDGYVKGGLQGVASSISDRQAERVRSAGMGDSRQSALVAVTVRARRGRVPTIAVGGAKRLAVSRPGPKPQAGDLLYGSEFGSNDWRFRGRRKAGYWIFMTLRRNHN